MDKLVGMWTVCSEPDLKPSFGVLNDQFHFGRGAESRGTRFFRIFKSYLLKYKKYDSSTNVTVALNTFKADVDQIFKPVALYSQGLLTYSSPPVIGYP